MPIIPASPHAKMRKNWLFQILPALLAVLLLLGLGTQAAISYADELTPATSPEENQPAGAGDDVAGENGKANTPENTPGGAAEPGTGEPGNGEPGSGNPQPLDNTQLINFLTDEVRISYGGQELTAGEDGKFTVHSDTPYQLRLKFREKPGVPGGQIPSGKDLTYKLPAGLQAFPHQKGKFTIQTSEGVVENNTYEIKDNVLHIQLAKDDALEASQQAEFFATFDVKFTPPVDIVPLGAGINLQVRISDDPDISITKTARHDFSAGKVFYTIKVKSIDTNENIEITDQIMGGQNSALKLDTNPKNLQVKSTNKHAPKPGKPEYANNGFKLVIPKMVHKEEVTITYFATVDYSKIDPAEGGTLEQTTNKVKISTDQLPDPKETENNLKNQLKIGTITKKAQGAKETAAASGIYEQSWVIRVNEYHKLKLTGYTISDIVPEEIRDIVKYSGEGIKVVNTTKPDAEGKSTKTEKLIPWAELAKATDSEWSYKLPADDPEYSSYEITYTTRVDVSKKIASTTVQNKASSDDGNPQTPPEEVTASSNPLRPPHLFNVEKKMLTQSKDKVSWQVVVNVVPQGYDSLVLEDVLPALTLGDKRFQDTLPENAQIEVKGLIGEESYAFARNAEHPERGFSLTFYKDKAKQHPGLNPLLDGNGKPLLDKDGKKAERKVEITFTTDNDQAWIAAYRAGESSLYRHTNQVKATANGVVRNASAVATPDLEGLRKSFTGVTKKEIDGVDYPVFNYRLQLEGLDKYEGDTFQVIDKFGADKLKLAKNPQPNISGAAKVKVTEKAGEIRFEVAKKDLPRYSDGEMHSTYYLNYALIPKDRAALDAINKNKDGLQVKNKALWGPVNTQETTGEYAYKPLTKEITEKPSGSNGYTATFQVTVNPGGLDIANGANSLDFQDEMTNLRLQPESLQMTPADYQYRPVYQGGVLRMQIPNKQKVVITYKAKVIGEKVVNYSNKVTVGSEEAHTSGTVALRLSFGGYAPNPGITLHKHDTRDLRTKLSGAEFALYQIKDGKAEPVVGKLTPDQKEAAPLVFTTGKDGEVKIKGDDGKLGWTFLTSDDKHEYIYELREVKAPQGYRLLEKPLTFSFYALPKDDTQQYDGAVLYIPNTPQPNTPPPGGDPKRPGLPQTGTSLAGVFAALCAITGTGSYLLYRRKRGL